jgi:hypothetical protein
LPIGGSNNSSINRLQGFRNIVRTITSIIRRADLRGRGRTPGIKDKLTLPALTVFRMVKTRNPAIRTEFWRHFKGFISRYSIKKGNYVSTYTDLF